MAGVSGSQRFPFVQLELAGVAGPEPGRYLGHDPERVLVVGVVGAPGPQRRRLRRAKPTDTDPAAAPPTVPLTTLTAIRAEPFENAEVAGRWLVRLRGDPEAIEDELADAIVFINRAVHAHRTASVDPAISEVTAERALAARIGFGSGDELADGRFSEAVELPPSERRRRVEALRPQERVAAVLSGRESVPAYELLLLRARADLDAGRRREAALQLRIGLEALLAGREALRAPEQEEDLAALEARRAAAAELGDGALGDQPSVAAVARTEETLELCERVVRRSRLR